MTGEPGSADRCPLCGRRFKPGLTTIPFIPGERIVLIKGVPAEICANCHEPFTQGSVTDRVAELLLQSRAMSVEVAILNHQDMAPVSVA